MDPTIMYAAAAAAATFVYSRSMRRRHARRRQFATKPRSSVRRGGGSVSNEIGDVDAKKGLAKTATRSHTSQRLASQRFSQLVEKKKKSRKAHPRIRPLSLVQQRAKWEKFVADNENTSTFTFHDLPMDYESFIKLLSLLRVQLNQSQGRLLKHGPILPEVQLYATLCWLAGGKCSEFLEMFDITSSFVDIFWSTIDEIMKVPELQLKFPKTEEECQAAALAFQAISLNTIDTCVCAVDGYHLEIENPTKTHESEDPESFYSHSNESYGMNIQAACDHQSRFLFLGVGGPGKRYDDEALVECPLGDMIENLPGDFCALGHCGYLPSEHLLPLFGCKPRLFQPKFCFNHFASKCRTTIERAIGLMVRRWAVLRKPLKCEATKVWKIVECLARLHNFCIDERILKNLPTGAEGSYVQFMSFGSAYRKNTALHARWKECLYHEHLQKSRNRDRIVARIVRKGYANPYAPKVKTSQESKVSSSTETQPLK